MLKAPSPPPLWMGWALRPRPRRPRWRRPAAAPQPTPPLAPSQSMVNTKPEQAEEESEEVREQKHKTFVEKYEKQIKHFGEWGSGRRGPRWRMRITGLGPCLRTVSSSPIPSHRHAPSLGR